LRPALAAGLLLGCAFGASEAAAEGLDPPREAEAGRPGVARGDAGSPLARRGTWRDPFALDISAVTLVPLSIGPELDIELPGRILAQVHVGWMPELYSQTLTDALENAGVYDDTVGALIDGALQSATTWRLAAGWRPFAKHGLEITLGYAHVSLEGATTTAELEPLVSPDVAEELNAELGNVRIRLDSRIHHVTAQVGWRWLIAERLVVRANLGYMQAFDSSTSLNIQANPEVTRLAAPTVESVLHDHYMRFIKIPVVGLGVGYRFF
jgi:hypothetical protein